MADSPKHTFELHHCIEQNKAFNQSPLLQALKKQGYNIHSPNNTMYLPDSVALGEKLGVSPHVGGPLESYSDVLNNKLRQLQESVDGQAAIRAPKKNPEAVQRVLEKVHSFETTLKTAILNGDLYTNVPAGMSDEQANAVNRKFYKGYDAYVKTHADQIEAIGKLSGREAQWVVPLKSEKNLVATVEAVNRQGFKPAGGDAFKSHASLREAINQAHSGGRLSVSEPAFAQLKEGFSAHVAEADARAAAAASRSAARGAALRSLVVGGVAVSLADAADAGERISSSLNQDNPLAAKSHAVHFAGRGAGGVIGGAAAGLIAGSWTGPGVLLTVAAGAYTGSEAGEKLAKMWDNRQVYHQVRDGVSWEFTGRQWVRERTADISRDDTSNAEVTTFAAPPEKARVLYLDALNAATALELKNAPTPRSPFIQPQAPGDTPSLDPASWERNSRTDQWERNVVVGRLDHAANATRREIASPERAAELDRAADQVIRENIASGQTPIAARYEIAYRASGFDLVGEKLPAASNVLTEGYLKASNGDLYRRNDNGQWLGLDGTPAAGNLPLELERTNAALQPQLVQHREYVAALAPLQPPSTEVGDRDRAILLDTYLQRGVEPTKQQVDAAMVAIARTREANDIAPGMTTFRLEPNAKKEYDITSSIVHVYNYSDDVPRIAAVTTAAEINQVRAEMQGRAAPIPDTPELRIEALSPQQRDAQEQALREANREGLSRDQVQQVAQHAAVQAASPDTPRPDAASIEPQPVRSRGPTVTLSDASPERERSFTPAPQKAVAAPVVELTPDTESRKPENTTRPEPPAPGQPQTTQPQEAPQTRSEPAPTVAAATAPAQPVAEPLTHAQDGTLRPGSQGQDVELLQYRLQRAGVRGPDGEALARTGQYDAPTERAVRTFQRDQGIPETGIADPETQHAVSVAQHARIRQAKDATTETVAVAQEAPQNANRPERVATVERAAPVVPAPSDAPSQPRHEHRSPAATDDELAHTAPPLDRTGTQTPPAAPPRESEHLDHTKHEPIANTPDREPEPEPFAASLVQPPHHAEMPRPSAREDNDQLREPSPQALTATAEPAFDRSQVEPRDRAMFDKIRNGAPANISDETVALAMLEAKRNGIPDVERTGPVGVANGQLWVGSVTPGYKAGVPENGPTPPIQDTLRETQAVNQQYDQQQREAQEREIAQQNQKQTDTMRPQI